ncbi:hypothetical protein DACRYDRAFT_118997 [Dacryopinax primogenitus]|uniref:MARVEL domain-containing protein n=1 Tax=Dacryopinax primogenitus (strain DJM 731) TaxID=1858805 RepID=M5FP76_DACPD|nr:uncharacterized protein DACRYDRAFT_118997 [Dacryopinax primogenitus]EJT98295.1 hypothetical protein DACRYDRAFT_118997 [Dacryopinax primogenitus]
MASRRSLPMMNVVNLLRLIVFFTILIFGLIVMGLTAHFAEILVPSDLTRFVTVGLVVSIITLIITTAIFLLGIFRTYIYAAQTRIELAWLGVLAVLWMALAVFLSASADVEIDCADAGGAIQENQSVGMTSDEFEAEYRAMQACSFINAILLVAWFLLLLSFAVAHHFSGYKEVWRTPVADYGWFINPLGSRRRRAMDEKVKQALGGLSSETSLSTEEEILGRSRTRHRVRERDREAVGRNALLPVALFRPFYAIPEGATNRPKPARAATQPIIDISARQTNPIHALGSGHPASRPTTPVRPAPPVRMNSTPQPGRQATPPLVTALSRNVSAKSAQTFMTAKSAQSARTPVVPSQRPRTPVTTTPQRPRTPVTAGPPRPKTPVNAVQPARSAVPPTQRPRTPVSTSQPGRPPTQPVRSASQTAVPQRTGSQSSPIRPVVVRTASTPQSAPAGQPPSAPTSRARQTSSSQRPRPPPIVTTTSAAKQLPSPVAPQAGLH